MGYLRKMLLEAAPDDGEERGRAVDHIDTVLGILRERRASAARRKIPVVSVVAASDVERFLRFGLIGRFNLPPSEAEGRRQAARDEVGRLADLVERHPIGVQIGIVEEMPPSQTFQVFERSRGASVTLSPYRLGDQPNISAGIAMVTSAPEAVSLFKETISRQWERAHKGQRAADILRAILVRTPA
jgi:hypothetical protein